MPIFVFPRTARPTGSVRLLVKRRAWFDETDRDGQGDSQGDGGQGNGRYNPPNLEEANRIIQSLLKRLDERDAAFEAFKKQSDERLSAIDRERKKKLEEEGNFKALLDQANAELTSLKAYQERARSLEDVIRDGNKTLIERIPEDRRGMVTRLAEKLPPEELRAWLDENLALLVKQPAPDFDAGAGAGGGSGAQPVKLTEEEKMLATAAGMSEKDYAEYKAQKGQPVERRTASG